MCKRLFVSNFNEYVPFSKHILITLYNSNYTVDKQYLIIVQRCLFTTIFMEHGV